jgi:hypothetical protein
MALLGRELLRRRQKTGVALRRKLEYGRLN